MCSPGVPLQPIYLPDLSGDDNFCWGGDALDDFRFAWFYRIFHGKAAGSILDLSPRLSNWNLSLQNESMQGLAGYCTQGTDCSSKGPFTFKLNTTLFRWNHARIHRWQAKWFLSSYLQLLINMLISDELLTLYAFNNIITVFLLR